MKRIQSHRILIVEAALLGDVLHGVSLDRTLAERIPVGIPGVRIPPGEAYMWTQYDSGFEDSLEKAQDQNHDPLSRFGQLVSIGGGIVVIVTAIVSAIRGGPSYLFWVLVGVALLLIISATYKPIRIRLRIWSERSKDRNVARENWPKFRNLVHRFGDFVSTQTNDTLHYIIANDIPEPMRTDLNKLIVPISLWYGFWHSFMSRVDREPPVLSELAYAVQEFYHLVSQYSNFCIAPIFEHLSPQLRQSMTEQSKAKLNTFRERYGHLRNDCVAFGKQLSESRPQLQRLPSYLQYPTQL